MLGIRKITHQSELEPYRDEWESLLEESANADFHLTFEWLQTWLDSFWKDRPIAFAAVERKDRLVALAPLLEDQNGTLWCRRSLVFPVNSFSARADILTSEDASEVMDALISDLVASRKRLRLGLKHILAASPVVSAVSTVLQRHRVMACVTPAPSSPILFIKEGWEEYLKSKSKHFRSEWKRKRRKLEKAGSVRIQTVSSLDECAQGMHDILAIERNSWKEAHGSSFTAVAGLADFYRRLAERCAEKGWLRIYLLHFDGKPVAHIYGVVYRNIFYAIKTSYDEALRRLSPGVVLFEQALRDSFEDRLCAFEFLGEEARWKTEIANDVRQRLNVCVFSRRDIVCRGCRVYQQQLKPFVKSKMPFLMAAKKRLVRT